jgi:hypothetical protein
MVIAVYNKLFSIRAIVRVTMIVGIRLNCGISTAIIKCSIRSPNGLDAIATFVGGGMDGPIYSVTSNGTMSIEVARLCRDTYNEGE